MITITNVHHLFWYRQRPVYHAKDSVLCKTLLLSQQRAALKSFAVQLSCSINWSSTMTLSSMFSKLFSCSCSSFSSASNSCSMKASQSTSLFSAAFTRLACRAVSLCCLSSILLLLRSGGAGAGMIAGSPGTYSTGAGTGIWRPLRGRGIQFLFKLFPVSLRWVGLQCHTLIMNFWWINIINGVKFSY